MLFRNSMGTVNVQLGGDLTLMRLCETCWATLQVNLPNVFGVHLGLSSLTRLVRQRAGWDIHSGDGGRTMRCKYTCRSQLDYCIGEEKQRRQRSTPYRAMQPQTPTDYLGYEVRSLEL
jgi:hypothetical protein